MKGNSTHTDQYEQMTSLADLCSEGQKAKPCLSADRQEADGQGAPVQLRNVTTTSDHSCSMAVSVTRHASNPFVDTDDKGYAGRESGRESSNSTNSLPEKGEQNQDVLRVVESGKELRHERGVSASFLLSFRKR